MRPAIYSKARIAGHPIHPMLVHFPIALFLGGLIALLVFAGGGDLFWYRVSYIAFLAGAATGLLAGLVGMIDLFGGIPDRTPARRTGIQHMALNIVAIIVFASAGLLMYGSLGNKTSESVNELLVSLPLVLAICGALLLTVSGTLGSKLSYKHHVGQEIDEDDDVALPTEGHQDFGLSHRARVTDARRFHPHV